MVYDIVYLGWGVRRTLTAYLQDLMERTRSLSMLLKTLPEDGEGPVSLDLVIRHFGRRSLGALLFILALPNIFPMPPGASVVLGFPLLLIAPQLVVGAMTPWAPASIRKVAIDRAALTRLCERAMPWVVRVEHLTRRRLTFMFGHAGDILMGIICTLLALILILPLPLGNVLPALALAVLALSLVQRDGLLTIGGYILTLAAIAVLVLTGGAIWALVTQIWL